MAISLLKDSVYFLFPLALPEATFLHRWLTQHFNGRGKDLHSFVLLAFNYMLTLISVDLFLTTSDCFNVVWNSCQEASNHWISYSRVLLWLLWPLTNLQIDLYSAQNLQLFFSSVPFCCSHIWRAHWLKKLIWSAHRCGTFSVVKQLAHSWLWLLQYYATLCYYAVMNLKTLRNPPYLWFVLLSFTRVIELLITFMSFFHFSFHFL